MSDPTRAAKPSAAKPSGANQSGANQSGANQSGANQSGEVAEMSFEDALAELEQIVRGLEGGQQKLEDAIGAYERGAALRRHCEAKLAQAEARVAAIVERADGTLGIRPTE